MRYIINLSRKLGENLYDTIVIESTEDVEEWGKDVRALTETFRRCSMFIGTTSHPKEDEVITTVYIKTKID